MYCKKCGKEIDETATFCPACGAPVSDRSVEPVKETAPAAPVRTNQLAIVGFVLSFFVALAGLICSIIARKQCRENGEGGAGFALAGIIISIAEIVLVLFYVVIFVVVVAHLPMA